jgi:Arc/MetJ family transcription regulator
MTAVAKKKTYNLDEELISSARKVLDARTDTETIQRALRKVVEDAQIERALEALLAEGRFRTVFR